MVIRRVSHPAKSHKELETNTQASLWTQINPWGETHHMSCCDVATGLWCCFLCASLAWICFHAVKLGFRATVSSLHRIMTFREPPPFDSDAEGLKTCINMSNLLYFYTKSQIHSELKQSSGATFRPEEQDPDWNVIRSHFTEKQQVTTECHCVAITSPVYFSFTLSSLICLSSHYTYPFCHINILFHKIKAHYKVQHLKVQWRTEQ